MMRRIPFNKPFVDKKVLEYLEPVLGSDKLSGDGEVCKRVEERIKREFGFRHVLLTTSCTHALEMAMMMLDLKPGDEVIVPSFTFVSTANAVLSGGGKPIFCDIREDTLTMDSKDVERKLSPRTRAVIPVHYAGVSADMDEIAAVVAGRGVMIVEDAAQGMNASYKGRNLGGIGDAAAFSFHDTKNFVSGEGGAFVTNDEQLARKGEIIREKGTNRSNFLRGEVDKYTWVAHGSSYVLSDILAAVLEYQLDLRHSIQTRRSEIHRLYVDGLKDLELGGSIRLPVIPSVCSSNYHIFYLLMNSEAERNRMLTSLKADGVGSVFHYVPLHSSPFAVNELGTGGLSLPVTDRVSSTLLRLPMYPGLSNEEVAYIVDRVRNHALKG